MNRILNEKVPVDKAVDEMIARIKVVADDLRALSRGCGPACQRLLAAGLRPGREDPLNTATLATPRPRKPLGIWGFWGRAFVVPYVLVFLVFVLFPVGYGLWLARQPGELRQAVRRPDLLPHGDQHDRLPRRGDQHEDAGRAVPVRLFPAQALVDQGAGGAVHPALGGAVDPDHPVGALHAQPRMGRDQQHRSSGSPAWTGRTG